MRGAWRTKRRVQAVLEDRPDITLAEIADFQFCPRGWWLRRMGCPASKSEEQREGVLRHAEAGAAVVRAVQLERAVQGLVGLAVLVTLLAVAGLALRTF